MLEVGDLEDDKDLRDGEDVNDDNVQEDEALEDGEDPKDNEGVLEVEGLEDVGVEGVENEAESAIPVWSPSPSSDRSLSPAIFSKKHKSHMDKNAEYRAVTLVH